jgi:hypothetical protein
MIDARLYSLCRHPLVLRFYPSFEDDHADTIPMVLVRFRKRQVRKENDPHVLLVQMKMDVKVIGLPGWRDGAIARFGELLLLD